MKGSASPESTPVAPQALTPERALEHDVVLARLLAKCRRNAKTGCLEWTASLRGSGYANAWDGQNCVTGHRLHWALVNGPIPAGVHILHHCDNRLCLELTHLYAGTLADNVRDREQRGRGVTPANAGENNPFARLTNEQARTIREQYACGATKSDLALAYGVTPDTIYRITRRAGWLRV